MAVLAGDDLVLQLREQLQQEQERRKRIEYSLHVAQDIIDGINAIIWEADHETFQFKFVNKRAETILGYPVSDWLGDPAFWLSILHPEDRKWAVTFCSVATEQGRDHEFEYRALARDGRTVWLHDKVYIIRDSSGRVQKLRGFMTDITERKQAEQRLADANERLRQAQLVAGLGIVDWDLTNNTVTWSVELPALQGIAPDGQFRSWMAAIHDDDRMTVENKLQSAIGGLMDYELAFRIRKLDGTYCALKVRGRILAGEDGKPARALGVVMLTEDQYRATAS